MALEIGDAVPEDMAVFDREGNPFPLRRLRGEAALLIFLRHLG